MCRAKGGIMASPRLPNRRCDSENLLGLLGFDAMSESEMERISIIPVEIANPHGTPALA